ncbi:Ribonuclease/ribotoxin [Pisolithus marmoratus]|nr:Ribonuclease/ribotoxin [Pisolithus marmoratus]
MELPVERRPDCSPIQLSSAVVHATNVLAILRLVDCLGSVSCKHAKTAASPLTVGDTLSQYLCGVAEFVLGMCELRSKPIIHQLQPSTSTHTQVRTVYVWHSITQTRKEYTCKTYKGNYKIDEDKAKNNVHLAPLYSGRTGYPHLFHHYPDHDDKHHHHDYYHLLEFDNKKCNKKDAHLLAFPLFEDGHLYPYDKEPKADPGLVRAIYTAPDKDFCGVLAHKGGRHGLYELCV